MSKETVTRAEAFVAGHVRRKFDKVFSRMKEHNFRIMRGHEADDNPHAIAEEANSWLPWLNKNPKTKYVVEGEQVVGFRRDEG